MSSCSWRDGHPSRHLTTDQKVGGSSPSRRTRSRIAPALHGRGFSRPRCSSGRLPAACRWRFAHRRGADGASRVGGAATALRASVGLRRHFERLWGDDGASRVGGAVTALCEDLPGGYVPCVTRRAARHARPTPAGRRRGASGAPETGRGVIVHLLMLADGGAACVRPSAEADGPRRCAATGR